MSFWKSLLGSARMTKPTNAPAGESGDIPRADWDGRATQLIATLREEVGKPDWWKRYAEVSSLIIAEGPRITRALASLALEFDPDHQDRDANGRLAGEAVSLIGKIGGIDDDMAEALYKRFIRGRNPTELQAEPTKTCWFGLYRQVGQTLHALGYLTAGGPL